MLWFESDGSVTAQAGSASFPGNRCMVESIRSQREYALSARRNMTAGARARASEIICDRVCSTRAWYASDSLACFLPMQDEVDTREIIERSWRANKRVFVPVLRASAEMAFCEMAPDTELERNQFGIWEPVRGFLINARLLDLVVTPTVAYDSSCNRIGMGSGYYDRCFAHLRYRRHWVRPKLIGVAFQCQEVEKIEPNPWDIRLYRVISDA